MAVLDEADAIRVGTILTVPPYQVSDQVQLMNSGDPPRFTDAVKTALLAQLTAWDAGPGTVTEYARLHPKESNKGVETDPDRDADKIREAIANLLHRPDWANVGGAVEFELVRG